MKLAYSPVKIQVYEDVEWQADDSLAIGLAKLVGSTVLDEICEEIIRKIVASEAHRNDALQAVLENLIDGTLVRINKYRMINMHMRHQYPVLPKEYSCFDEKDL